MADTWRIDELQAVAEQALLATQPAADLSGRVRAVPDARTIRYYTTLGLIDRPAEMRGRIAFYNRKHVLQLVAIKRLQANGLTLEQVQERLAGATTRKLAEVAELPKGFWERTDLLRRKAASGPANEPASNGATKASATREDFWQAPAQVAQELPKAPEPPLIPSLRLPLAPGVALELNGIDFQKLTPEALNQLTPQLRLLAQELARLGLVVEPAPLKPEAPAKEETASSSFAGASGFRSHSDSSQSSSSGDAL